MNAKPEVKSLSPPHPLGLLGIFALAFAARIIAVDVPINVDEVKWLHRGLRFVSALIDRDLAATYFQHHPGVTTLWVNGSSAMLHCLLRDSFPSALNLDRVSLPDCARILKAEGFPLETYAIARGVQAIVTSASMTYLYVLARRLLGEPIALLGTILLTFEPFFLGYQRFLTTDAFQTNFTAIALFLLLLYLRGDGRRWLLFGSGLSMGLAVASKTPALTAIPAIVTWIALIELGAWRSSFPRRGLLRQVFDLGLWGSAIAATFFIIWPALWVAPVQTALKLIRDLQGETERGQFFFLGQVTDAPGMSFYPLVLLYRLSPLLLLGLVLLALWALIPKLQRSLPSIPELTALALVAVFVVFILSNSDNKIDRYIMPVIPPLTFLAAAGWVRGLSWLGRSRLTLAIGLGLLTLGQIAFFLPHFPYVVSYYNPLLGGAAAAERVFMLGNGEGLDRSARWLARAPDIDKMEVATWYSSTFSPYFQRESLDIGKTFNPQQPWWQKAHRVVFYVNQFQRQLPSPEVLAYFSAQVPLHTVNLNGVDYARTYPGAIALPSEIPPLQTQPNPVLNDAVRLRGAQLAPPRGRAGERVGITLYWEVLKAPLDRVPVRLAIAKDGRIWVDAESSILAAFVPHFNGLAIAPGTILRDFHQLVLPPEFSKGRYTVYLEDSAAAKVKTPLGEFEVI